jgi:hypothetical protein
MKKVLVLCGLLAMVTRPAGAGDQLKLTVSPAHAFAPALLRIQVRIAPSVENRTLEMIADSATFYRSSEIQLEGDRSPATFNLEIKAVPEGDYRVVGILRDGAARQRSIVYQDVTVLGPGGIGG